LAKTGIEERRLIFGSREVQGMEDCGLFNRLPDSEVSPFSFASHFCFIHLTLQELLAAREIAKMKPSDISDFISSNASDPKWHLVIQFVAGLLRGKENEAVNNFVIHLLDCLTANSSLLGEAESKQTKQKALLMLKCLYEYNDETIVMSVASELHENTNFNYEIDLSGCQVTPVECIAIANFVKHLEKPTVLSLYGNGDVSDQGVLHLCVALKNKNCQLIKLSLEDNSITDEGVSHLCGALKDVNCKLTEVNVHGNTITDQGISHLCDALKNVN